MIKSRIRILPVLLGALALMLSVKVGALWHDIALTVGQASQTVEVTGAPPLLQTDDSFLGTVLDARGLASIT